MHRFIFTLALFAVSYNFCFGQIPEAFKHITYKEGLSTNNINSFVEDKNGFLWIGTNYGLNRYNGYDIKRYMASNNSNGLPDNGIDNMETDQLGRIWLSQPMGYCLLNPEKEEFKTDEIFVVDGTPYPISSFTHLLPFGDSLLLFSVPSMGGILKHNIYNNRNEILLSKTKGTSKGRLNVTDLQKNGNFVYIVYNTGLIEVFDMTTNSIVKQIHTLEQISKLESLKFRLFIDSKNRLWAYAGDADFGLFQLSQEGEIIRRLNTQSTPRLNSDIIMSLLEDGNNNVWIGTDHGGINIFKPSDNTITYVINKAIDNNSLSQDVITSMFMSSDSTIWIGTFKQGINYYHPNSRKFKHYVNNPFDKTSLPNNDISCLAEDKKGNIWLGTNGEGLVYFDRSNNTYSLFKSENSNNGLLSDIIIDLFIDKSGIVWIATFHGGLTSYDGKKFVNYSHDPKNPKSIGSDRVWEIYEDSKDNLWIGLLGAGLDMFDREKQQFLHFKGSDANSVNSSFIMDIAEDKDGTVWFASSYGMYSYSHSDSRFRLFTHIPNDPNSLSHNFVLCVFVDSNNKLWVGTREGLNLLNKEEGTFVRFYEKDGLASNKILGIEESISGDLFLSTGNGISQLSTEFSGSGKYISHSTANYGESDGLQGREFNDRATLLTNNGEMLFGGSNGFNLFVPEELSKTHTKLKTHIVGINTYYKNRSNLLAIKGNEALLNTVLDKASVKIPYDIRMFSINFVAINFLNAKKTNYRYKLEGFNDGWIYCGKDDRDAIFTNLNPGKYRFVVQSSDYGDNWNDSQAYVDLHISPPIYRTLVAYILYFTLTTLAFLWLRVLILKRERNNFEHEQAIKESERQHELNQLKTRFFTNVSHELRTPLSLILTPLQKTLQEEINEGSRHSLELIYKNAYRLLTLVNQLLDFRKAEEKKLRINLTYGNIVNLIDQTVKSFDDFKESKHITFRHLPHTPEVFMQFDKDKIEKIIYNLLSNAFKFTADGGYINVISKLYSSDNEETLNITVEDNGIGMEEEIADRIFERFYQSESPSNFISGGSGIGLSLTKDFVELHRGKIHVESEPGKGSKFIIVLPVNKTPLEQTGSEETEIPDVNKTNRLPELDKQQIDSQKKTILLVEDNLDFRSYLKSSLSPKYNILEAKNGKEALDTLENFEPQLIVSDIMMPQIDGLQLCNEVKTNAKYSHIPIILLTAKSRQEDKLEGLKQGADEYITKPFSLEILENRIGYLLKLRKNFTESYQKTFTIGPNNESITSIDEKFLEKALKLVTENISNPEFSVIYLSKELGMSRGNLYKKMISLTGKSPVEYIRLVRLKRAVELILQNQLNISEIAYDVGYSDPKYFSKQFKAEYGVLPSKYKESFG